jgi:hypothetical protein
MGLMKRAYLVIILLLWTTVLLAACSGESTPMPEDVQPRTESETPVDEPYPGPGLNQEPIKRPSNQESEPYLEPSEPDQSQNPPDVIPPPADHEFAPSPGDDVLTRGNVFVDASDVILLESYPVQVELLLMGNLPTPCHQLRAIVSSPDDQNYIEIEVYSLTDPDMICTQVLDPFEARIPLGAYAEGSFTVLVNGEVVESFDLP